jgi:hypothetical protein
VRERRLIFVRSPNHEGSSGRYGSRETSQRMDLDQLSILVNRYNKSGLPHQIGKAVRRCAAHPRTRTVSAYTFVPVY